MANLRANKIYGTSGPDGNGSALFNGTDYLTAANAAAFRLNQGSGEDFTIEAWIYVKSYDTQLHIAGLYVTSGNKRSYLLYVNTSGELKFNYSSNGTAGATSALNAGTIPTNEWIHVALTHDTSATTARLFKNGVLKASDTGAHATFYANTDGDFEVGTNLDGFISNLHINKGTCKYTASFDPYKQPIEVETNTTVLCCNSSTDALNDDKSNTFVQTASGGVKPTSDMPFSRSDGGVVFDGDIKINSQGYMYFPTGTTEERGRSSRGIWAGGYKAPWAIADNVNSLEYFNIQTTGNAVDFGDRSVIQNQGLATVASSTRGVMMGGRAYNHPSPGQVTITDTIDYVTIANTGDAIDFGNLIHGAGYIHAAGSNSTRGVLFRSSDGDMEYVTIATTGNSVDTGSDSTVGRNTFSGFASPTRAFWAGGANPSGGAAIGSIDYLEISSLGVPQDFGDLTFTGHNQGAASNTRGIIFTGGFPTATSNVINYITMATTGNATDFGDTLNTMGGHSAGSGCSNSIRAVRCGGYTAPNASQNWIDYVTIQSTGNSVDFGDLITIRHGGSGFSDSHGGLS